MNPYDWPDWHLLVTFKNRHGTYTFLADHVSQEQVLEHWNNLWEADRDRRLTSMDVQRLTVDAYEVLEPLFEARYIVE